MLVVMHSHATPQQIEAVVATIREMKLAPHPLPGPTRTAIAITGNLSVVDPRALEVMPGVMELLPPDQIAFQRMLDTIRRNFERFGFLPIETPVMEFSDVLLTKQGGETERQVYFVQSTGALEQGGKPDLALLADYQRLIKLRKDHPVLRHGTIDAPAYLDDHVIVLIRRDGDRWAVTALNNDAAPHTIAVDLPQRLANAVLDDVLTGNSTKVPGTRLTLTVPPRFGTVLENHR